MIIFLNKFKKPCFWPIFGPFSQYWEQNIFPPENPALSCTTSYRFLAPCQNLDKTNDAIPRTYGQTEERTEGQTDPISLDPSGYCWGVQKQPKNQNWNLIQNHLSFPFILFIYYFELLFILLILVIRKNTKRKQKKKMHFALGFIFLSHFQKHLQFRNTTFLFIILKFTFYLVFSIFFNWKQNKVYQI